jgi:hypothetical protein
VNWSKRDVLTAVVVWLSLMAVAAVLIAIAWQLRPFWPEAFRENPSAFMAPLVLLLVVSTNAFLMLLGRRARRASGDGDGSRGHTGKRGR